MRIADVRERVYLVKLYRNAKLMGQIKDLFRGSRSLNEFKAAHKVAERNIPAFLPAAAGEKKKFGLVSESYLVMEKVEGCTDLAKYLLQDEREADIQERKKVIDNLGRLTRRIHDQGVLQVDLALNNFLITSTQTGESQLFMSDFEKVKFLNVIPEHMRLKGLAKLNRIGRKVSLAERIRFLKAYLHPESKERKRLHAMARALQLLTLKILKEDGQRGRMTSVYTDRFYKTYREREFRGFYHDGYDGEEFLQVIHTWDKGMEGLAKVEVNFRGIPIRVKAKCYTKIHQRNSAALAWSNAFTLALGTLPVILPLAFFEKIGTGSAFIFLPSSEKNLTLREFLSRDGSSAIADLSQLLFKIHYFGSFSGKISEETFAFPIENNRAIPYLTDLDFFTIQKEITPQDREKDLSSLISVLSSFREQKEVERIVRSYYPKKGSRGQGVK